MISAYVLIFFHPLNIKRNVVIEIGRTISWPGCLHWQSCFHFCRSSPRWSVCVLGFNTCRSDWAVEAGRLCLSWRCSSLSSNSISVITGRFDYQGFIDTHAVALWVNCPFAFKERYRTRWDLFTHIKMWEDSQGIYKACLAGKQPHSPDT